MRLLRNEAKSYLRKSKVIKISLRACFLGSILCLLGTMYYEVTSNKIEVSIIRLIATNLLKIEVRPAVIAGITSKGLKYNITSDTIKNYISNFLYDDNINFDKPIFDIETNKKKKIHINAIEGIYDEKNKLFLLKKNVEISTDNGLVFLREAIFDIKKEKLFSNYQISGSNDKFAMTAEGFVAYDNFTKIRLLGPVIISDK